jgi:hypothetical protein
MNTAKSPTELPATPGSALVSTRDRKKLEAIGKKMESLLKQVDELFGDARDIIGFEHRDSESYTEELEDYWEDMAKALVSYAIKSRCRWKQEEVIERMTAEMKKLEITPDMLSGQNTPSELPTGRE